MSSKTSFDRETLSQELIVRGWKDPVFRELLEHDPKAAIEEHVGHALPEDISVVVHSEEAETIHLVLPHLAQERPQVADRLEWLLDKDRIVNADTDEGCTQDTCGNCPTHDNSNTCTDTCDTNDNTCSMGNTGCPALRMPSEFEAVV